GTFFSDGNTIYTSQFFQGSTNRSSVYLDTSTVFTSRIHIEQSSLIFDADSAAFIVSGGYNYAGNYHYGKLVALSGIYITGFNQFDTLILNSNTTLINSNTIGTLVWQARGSMLVLGSGSTQTIIDTLIFNGACEGISAIETTSLGNAATISKASGNIFCDRILLEDINATGGATFTANNSVLNGTCAGWTTSNVPSARNLFWVAGSGRWSDTAHWSLSSGGQAGECAPTPIDVVSIDAQSFSPGNDTLTDDLSFSTCAEMDWSAAAVPVNFLQGISLFDVYGPLVLNSSMNYSPGVVRLRSGSVNTSFEPAGNVFGNLSVYGTGGYDLVSNLSASYFMLAHGSFNSNTHFISGGMISGNASSASVLQFSGSAVSCGYWTMSGTTGNFSAPQKLSVGRLTDYALHAYDTVVFSSGAYLDANCSFSEVTVTGNANIYGNNTFNKLHFLTPGALIQFQFGSTQIINTLMDVQSNCVATTMLQSTLAGNTATLSKASGSIVLNDVILEDITGAGGGNFIGLNTIATFNVNGWNITPPPGGAMYWIGGTGNWNDPQHWSLTSGGVAGTCVPNPLNDVFFDSLSFTGNTDVVSIPLPFTYCRSMDWTGCTGSPKLFSTSALNTLRVYGSMLLDQNVSANQAELYFRSHTPGETINTNGQPLGYIRIDGFNGTWDLQGPMQADSLEIINGVFKTAGQQLNVQIMRSDSSSTRGLDLDSSIVYVNKWIVANDNSFFFDAGTSHMNISGTHFYGGFQRKYNEVYFSNAVTLYDADTFGIARFTNMTSLRQSCIFDTLFLDNPGYSISLGTGTTQTINGKFFASSTAQRPIGVESSDISGTATLLKTQDTLCTDFLVLRGMAATGGAVFYAGAYSADAGNNSGWTFQNCYPQTIDVWPGDANRDLVADNLDLLAIGVAFGQTRTPRANASNNWTAQPSWIWEILFANASDIVNADCDGDGTIGFGDTTAVLLNYSLTHPARLAAPDSIQSVGLPFYFSVPSYPVPAGDTTSIGLMLGDVNAQANNIYGIAFTMHYTANAIVTGSTWLEFTNSWLAPTGYVVYLLKDFPAQHEMDLAICRIDHTNMSGAGEIGRLHFQLDPSAAGTFKCWYTDVIMIDYNENQYPTQVTLGSFQILLGVHEITEQGFNAYPNPTDGSYTIDDAKLSGCNSVIEIMDMSGRILQETKSNGATSVTLHMEEFPAGTYFVRLINEKGIFVERMVKR
ncbi:MAG: T9SS type A sorting domain-containing protein, partial [Bacteroidota bacterium]|nr:T9SS type A sorting domain-containing protein [Bacteroidota bacterium]